MSKQKLHMQVTNTVFVPDHIEKLQPYKPGKASDVDAYSAFKAIICSNENNLGPSPKAIEAIREASSEIHFYPDPQAEKLVQKLSQRHNRKFDDFVLSNGLDGLLYSMFKAFTLPGDHVITSQFSFVAFNKFSKMNNVILDIAPMKGFYEFDLERMLAMVKEGTRMIYLCNPNNPTGSAIKEEDLLAFLDQVPSHILVVVDEAYFEFARNLDTEFPDSIAFNRPNVLSLRTLSKVYGLAGLRIGYGVGHADVISALKKVKLVFNPNVLAQVAALAALDDDEHLEKTLDNNKKWMKIVVQKLEEQGLNYVPSRANFVTAIFTDKSEAQYFNQFMLDHGVMLRQLNAFELSLGVRISIGNDSEMEHFCSVLSQYDPKKSDL